MKFSIIAILLAISIYAIVGQVTVTGYNFADFQIKNSYIYGVNFNLKRFQILSIASATSPTLYGQIFTTYSPFRVVVSGRYAFYLETNYYLQSGNAIDISYDYGYLNAVDGLYPSSPNIIWSSSSIKKPHALAVANNMVFVSADQLYAYNFSIPNAPVLLTMIPVYYPCEITAKMIDANNYILLAATKYYLYSYKFYRSGSSFSYIQSDNRYNNARDVFLSGNSVFVVAGYNVLLYTVDNNGNLYNNYTRNSAISKAANSIIYDNNTNYQYINYQSGSTGISEFNIISNSYCTYTFGYQTDTISISGRYFFATQSSNGAFLVIDRNLLSCAYNNNNNNGNSTNAIGVIIGIVFAVIFFILFMACIICLSVRRHRRMNAFRYKPLENQNIFIQQPYPIQPIYSSQPVYSTQPVYSPQIYTMQPNSVYDIPQGNPPPYNPEVVPPEFTSPELEQKK